jgi:hypothetical protein
MTDIIGTTNKTTESNYSVDITNFDKYFLISRIWLNLPEIKGHENEIKEKKVYMCIPPSYTDIETLLEANNGRLGVVKYKSFGNTDFSTNIINATQIDLAMGKEGYLKEFVESMHKLLVDASQKRCGLTPLRNRGI